MRILVYAIIGLLFACNEPAIDKPDEKSESITSIHELQAIDAEFSAYSKKHGFRKAFLEYIDDDGVLMRDNSRPFMGARAIEYLTSLNDSSVTMTWEPQGGEISASGDLGYTFGIYEMRYESNELEKGSYITIWKKQKDGTWKFVLDSNNQGVGE